MSANAKGELRFPVHVCLRLCSCQAVHHLARCSERLYATLTRLQAIMVCSGDVDDVDIVRDGVDGGGSVDIGVSSKSSGGPTLSCRR